MGGASKTGEEKDPKTEALVDKKKNPMSVGAGMVGGEDANVVDDKADKAAIEKRANSINDKRKNNDEDDEAKEGGHRELTEEEQEEQDEINRRNHVFPISKGTLTFQALMILAAMYMSMLCTNWGNVQIFDNTTTFFEHNDNSFWLKISAEWMSMGIYLLSLLGPLCLPNRNWES